MNARRLLAGLGAALLAASCSTQARDDAKEFAPPPPRDTASYGRPSVEHLLDTGTTVVGEPFAYPSGASPLISAQVVTIAPGQSTGWHRHAVPTFGYILSGRVDMEYEGSGRRVLAAGDRLVESMQASHNATNLGTEPVRILAVFLGAQGKPNVIQTAAPAMPSELAKGRAVDLVELPQVDPSLRIDLRYAGANNFTGHVIYPAARAWMQRPAAEALARVNRRARDKGLALLVLDAYRPWSVTRMFWDSFPMHRAYLADPLSGSRHNRGCAVDLTLLELATGREVTMPSGYDDFSERAHPAYAGGSPAERASRDLLRALMEAEGFSVYENEWWHFDYKGWQDYPVLDVPLDNAAPPDR